MTTARQIRKLVRPLLERHPDLTLATSHTLWMAPLTHVGIEIWLERASMASYFRPRWFLTPLFLPTSKPAYGAGFCCVLMGRSQQAREAGRRSWDWDDPEMPADFVSQIEEAIPLFRSLDTLNACRLFTEKQMKHPWGKDLYEQIVYDIAFGNLALARCWWQRLETEITSGDLPTEDFWRTKTLRFRSLREPLMDDDRAALAALLHQWERENVTGTPVERIWQPTPFPLEQIA